MNFIARNNKPVRPRTVSHRVLLVLNTYKAVYTQQKLIIYSNVIFERSQLKICHLHALFTLNGCKKLMKTKG